MKKNFLFLSIFLVIIISVLTTGCQDEEIQPGIIYTNDPPEELFPNRIYADADRGWIENDDLARVKVQDDNTCNFYRNDYDGSVEYYDCGTWRLIPVRQYWGILDGIIYLSQSYDWYLIGPERFIQIHDQIEKKGTLVVYLCNHCQTPYGTGENVITGWQ
jgi:hypothetical protein